MSNPGPGLDQYSDEEMSCPIFGVESGGPIIGLGLLMIFFGVFPIFSGTTQILPLPLIMIFIGFGIFLIWLGVKK